MKNPANIADLVRLEDEAGLERLADAVRLMAASCGRPSMFEIGLGWAILCRAIVLCERAHEDRVAAIVRADFSLLEAIAFRRSIAEASADLGDFLEQMIAKARNED